MIKGKQSTKLMMTDSPNIILLSIDALRADHLGNHGYERDTSPFLDSFAERSINFETAISASSHTREAVPALLTGRYPDIFADNGYRCVTDTVVDRLSNAGYATGGFHSNPYISRAYGFDSGFDKFDDDLRLGQHRYVALVQRALDKFLMNKGEYHARADIINQRSLDWLDTIKSEPFFLWNHYMDSHGPYNPPNGYTYAGSEISNSKAHDLYQKTINEPEQVTEHEREHLLDCYDGEVRYLDEQLRAFFRELSKRNLIEDSLVIVTADHGDAFGEHGYYTHPRRLHDYLLHVPLIVSKPSKENRQTVETPVSILDIVPTILDSIDASFPELPGASLISQDKPPVWQTRDFVFSSATGEGEKEGTRLFAARGSDWKVILQRVIDSGQITDEVAYHLMKDPKETTKISPTNINYDNILDELKAHSATRIDASNVPTSETSIGASSNEIDKRLEALGYK